jgi:hypothetical protein
MLKPVPLIVIEPAFAARLALLDVTAGAIVLTWTGKPLVGSFGFPDGPTVTTAVSSPAVVGSVEASIATVSCPAVAEVILFVSSSPASLSATESLLAVGSKPLPLMVIDCRPAARLVVSWVTVGPTEATSCCALLSAPPVDITVTTAFTAPPVTGPGLRVRSSVLASGALTFETTAPSLRLTRSLVFAFDVLKPYPLMTREVAPDATLAVLVVTSGRMVATWTAPLVPPLVLTVAFSGPAVGPVLYVTVMPVTTPLLVTTPVTVPVAALLTKETVFCEGVALKPLPLMVIVLLLASRLAVLPVTTGATVATCTKAPLLARPTVTEASSSPEALGGVANVTVSEVGVAEVTVPATAPSSKVTWSLLSVVGSNP